LARTILDHPNRANAMHVQATPRIGGLALVITVAVALLFIPGWKVLAAPMAVAGTLAAISLIDDRVGLSAALRIAAHLAGTTLLVLLWVRNFTLAPPLLLSPFGVAVLILAVTWMTNLYNFMDGADGLAGGMALIGFGGYAIAASQSPAGNAAALASMSAVIAGAALGFLWFNFPPAKVFMGDAGSIPLGFLAGVFGVHGVVSGVWPWWFPLLIFSPFIVDATVTLCKRVWRLERIWQAHRTHYYHRLILNGWNHRRTALVYYLLMLLCAGSALYARTHAIGLETLGFWVVTYGLLLATLEWRFTRKNKNS
jgi:UDP-N-acetylmuramyl pentapeptide phosphotransferase/UDP-N-acetylglucosamine-1-phosphate transferase